jgi:hypothetical protein
VNAPGLTAERRELRGVADGLGTTIHVALTARCELHSGPLPSLKQTESGCPERHQKQKSPAPGNTACNQGCRGEQTDDQEAGAEKHSLPPFLWTDVGNLRH